MDRNVAQLNIEHYRRVLEAETDPAKRETIGRLVAEEEAKLRLINAQRERERG